MTLQCYKYGTSTLKHVHTRVGFVTKNDSLQFTACLLSQLTAYSNKTVTACTNTPGLEKPRFSKQVSGF